MHVFYTVYFNTNQSASRTISIHLWDKWKNMYRWNTHVRPIIQKLRGESMTEDAVFLIGFWKQFCLSILLNNLLISINLSYKHTHKLKQRVEKVDSNFFYTIRFLPHAAGSSPQTRQQHSHSSDTYWPQSLNTQCLLHAPYLKHTHAHLDA